jgi:hypothetical protein
MDMSLFGGMTYTQSGRTPGAIPDLDDFHGGGTLKQFGHDALPRRVQCWMMTNAMPLPAGTRPRNCSRASSPPAEAPMPTIGKDTAAGVAEGAADGFRRAERAGFRGMRVGPVFRFMMQALAPRIWALTRRFVESRPLE